MKELKISDIEHINLAILILGSAATILIMREFKYLFSFAVASAIMTMNFRFLRKIVEDVILAKVLRKRDFLIKLPIKFLIFAGLVAVVVIYGDISIMFFLIGLSTVFISIIISQIMVAFSSTSKRRQKNGA